MCGANLECVTGHCVDGLCCDTKCTDACFSCALGVNPGTCTMVAMGADPHGLCAVQPACGTTGQCYKGACAFAASGTSCGKNTASACNSDGYSHPDMQCDGSGNCKQVTVDCRPYACALGSCRSGACAAQSIACLMDTSICASGCSCHMGTTCNASVCMCP
jgi:hypothetical protein